MSVHCPWCGHLLTDNLTACEKCKWTREKPNMKPAMLAFGFIIVLSAVLGFVAMRWVSSQTGDIRPPLNGVVSRSFAELRGAR